MFFISIVNKDCPNLIALIYDFSAQFLLKVRHSSQHVLTFDIPCCYQSMPSIIIYRGTAVTISRLSLNLRPTRFCFSPESRCNPLATNLLDIVTINVGSLITTLQAIQSYFTTKPRIIHYTLLWHLQFVIPHIYSL